MPQTRSCRQVWNMPEHLHQEVKKSVFEGLRMETKQKKAPECDGYARGQHLVSLQVRLPARRLVAGGSCCFAGPEGNPLREEVPHGLNGVS